MNLTTRHFPPLIIHEQCTPDMVSGLCPTRWWPLRIHKIQPGVGPILWRDFEEMTYGSLTTSFGIFDNCSSWMVIQRYQGGFLVEGDMMSDRWLIASSWR